VQCNVAHPTNVSGGRAPPAPFYGDVGEASNYRTPRLVVVVVRASDLRSRGREFDSQPVNCRVAYVNSAFHPSRNRVSLLAAGVMRGIRSLVSGGR